MTEPARHRTIKALRALAVAAVAWALAACSGPRSILDPAGPSAQAIADIWWVMFGGAVVVWLLVVALLLIALLRRDNTRELARPQRLIVGGGLVLPTVLLGALLVWGTLDSARLTGIGEQPEAVVEVTARQWFWEFRYLDDDGNAVASSRDVLAMPLGRMVEFRITSADVIHSFWIPRLGGKMDAIPGRVNRLRLRADHDGAGTPIRGQCAEFCGLAHAHMHFDVEVLDDDAWSAWLHGHAVDATPAGGAP
ncbi:MAG: cytochrome c oxidase subunit II [Xanthomonadales bacterium]|nr:cytochrome c oxidase subunit II [Xanthomonadales bacterium]